MTSSKQPLDLSAIKEQVEKCRRCELACTRNNAVFGEGPADARVMIIGEAPGKNEDLGGRPFIGAAGKLLDELLAHAGISRDDVFIANVLKCRPPSNRDPKPEEIEQCADYLREQVRTISPEVLVTMGNFATRFILKSDRGITALRGKVYQAGRFKVIPVFHPAAALYDPTKKQVLFDDFAMLGKTLSNG